MRLLIPGRRGFFQNWALPLYARIVAMNGGTRALVAAVIIAGFAGCSGFVRNPTVNSKDPGFFGWHFHAPFDTSEVKTVAVFFKSNVFRRDLEKQLTEAVIKEIHLRSPYRVVASHEEADSLLTGTIYSDAKNLVVEAPTNLPRGLNASIMVQTKWTHNPPTDIESKQIATTISETLNFIPEVGDTTLSAYNHVIQSIAKQIVDMMEQPWYNDQDRSRSIPRRGVALNCAALSGDLVVGSEFPRHPFPESTPQTLSVDRARAQSGAAIASDRVQP